METLTIKNLKKGSYFKLVTKKGVSTSIYIINHYIREEKKFSISPVDDINKEKFVKATQLVTTEFEY